MAPVAAKFVEISAEKGCYKESGTSCSLSHSVGGAFIRGRAFFQRNMVYETHIIHTGIWKQPKVCILATGRDNRAHDCTWDRAPYSNKLVLGNTWVCIYRERLPLFSSNRWIFPCSLHILYFASSVECEMNMEMCISCSLNETGPPDKIMTGDANLNHNLHNKDLCKLVLQTVRQDTSSWQHTESPSLLKKAGTDCINSQYDEARC